MTGSKSVNIQTRTSHYTFSLTIISVKPPPPCYFFFLLMLRNSRQPAREKSASTGIPLFALASDAPFYPALVPRIEAVSVGVGGPCLP